MSNDRSAIWWIRRDLRLADNQALSAALADFSRVVPVFILDPVFVKSSYTGKNRRAFLFDGLRQLDQDLRKLGSYLVIRDGKPADELSRLCQEANVKHVYAEQDYSSYAIRRDLQVSQVVDLHLMDGLCAMNPGAVKKADGSPYTVYTHFMRAWKSQLQTLGGHLIPAPTNIDTPPGLTGAQLLMEPCDMGKLALPAGEMQAQRLLAMFSEGLTAPIYQYIDQRDFPGMEGTSRLSPYLRFGMLSARQAVMTALAAIAKASTTQAYQSAGMWLNELIWREFYISILSHFPSVQKYSFKPELRNIQWRNDPWEFAAWCEGKTGYPIVDAAMRQLGETGWMHNRARMIVASFLVKDLLIDWRWGERWFMQHLLDGDPASNNGGWQWTAGTGTDAAPYFRIFNPILQGQKFDPNGDYIRDWLPEIRKVPGEYIHTPWKMPKELQRWAGCIIGDDYPEPIVDHQQARLWTLAAYGKKP